MVSSSSLSAFDAYSAYYDLFYRDKPYEAELDWLIQKIRNYSPAACRLLDGGCGTGAYTQGFAQRGYEVLGIDMSPRMVELAIEKTGGRGNCLRPARPTPRHPGQPTPRHPGPRAGVSSLTFSEDSCPVPLSFVVGDVRDFRVQKPVDVVTLLFHVMSYQTSDDDVRRTLASCAANLEAGGLLCFDVWHAPAVLAQEPEKREKHLTEGDLQAVRHATPYHDEARRVVEVRYDIELRSPQGNENFTELHAMRYFSQPELASLLAAAGFELLEVAELVTGAPPSPATWGVCYFARKIVSSTGTTDASGRQDMTGNTDVTGAQGLQ